MKRLFIFLLSVVMLCTSCSQGSIIIKKNSDSAVDSSANSASEPKEEISEFYKMATNSNRPIAVMIDNDSDASRPQIGLEDAYLLYEIIVEGGSSRIMALFKNYDIEKIGPVRSSRHYFLDYALENEAIYTHAGWSPQAQRDIPRLGVNNINGITGSDGVNFWRDYTYDKTWHNLYTSTAKLSEYAKNSRGYSMEAGGSPIKFAKKDTPPEGDLCNEVSFAYSNMYRVSYTYNSESGMYERSINSAPHSSQTGNQLSAKNIIVYNVSNYDINDGQNKGRQELSNIGSGEGWYISMGKAEKITWSKSARDAKTVYTKADGTALEVNPGITYIQIIPRGNAVTIS